MKLHRDQDIALLLLSDLSKQPHNVVLSLRDVSLRHGVSELFLKKIVRQLKKNGLVLSKEGSGGGYSLAKEAGRITVWEVFQSLRPLHNSTLSDATLTDYCPIVSSCLPQVIHTKLTRVLKNGFEQITIADFLHN